MQVQHVVRLRLYYKSLQWHALQSAEFHRACLYPVQQQRAGLVVGIDCGGTLCVSIGRSCSDGNDCAFDADCDSNMCSGTACSDTMWTVGLAGNVNSGSRVAPAALAFQTTQSDLLRCPFLVIPGI